MKYRNYFIKVYLISTVLWSNFCLSQSKLNHITISLSGVVVDAKTLNPIPNAIIFDEFDKRVAESDKNGFFETKINVINSEEIYFEFYVTKSRYNIIHQREHWGKSKDLKGNYIIALSNKNEPDNSFSNLLSTKSLKHRIAINSLNKLRKEKNIAINLLKLMTGNKKILIEFNGDKFLVTNFNHFQLKKSDKIIFINDKPYSIEEVNNLINRDNIKNLTRFENPIAQFYLTTY